MSEKKKVAVFAIRATVWKDAEWGNDVGDPPNTEIEQRVTDAVRSSFSNSTYRGGADPLTVNVDVVRTDD